MAGIQLVAAADLRRDALEAFRAKYHGRVYDSVEGLCSDREVDAIMQSARERREIILTHQSPTQE